jgi:hypothetical protein
MCDSLLLHVYGAIILLRSNQDNLQDGIRMIDLNGSYIGISY